MYVVAGTRTGVIFMLFSYEFTHLGTLCRAISQVRAKGNGSSGRRKGIRVRFVRF